MRSRAAEGQKEEKKKIGGSRKKQSRTASLGHLTILKHVLRVSVRLSDKCGQLLYLAEPITREQSGPAVFMNDLNMGQDAADLPPFSTRAGFYFILIERKR